MWFKRGGVREGIPILFHQDSHHFLNHHQEMWLSFERRLLTSLWIVLVAQNRKKSVMSSEAGHSMRFYRELRAYRQLLKPEGLSTNFCSSKMNVGRVFKSELPDGQELLTLVRVLPPQCCKWSMKSYPIKPHFSNPCWHKVKNFKPMPQIAAVWLLL